MSTIELKGITKLFGALAAVRDVDLTVAAGETVCLLGPSGCGKTTTLRIVAGLEQATAGDVFVAGKRMNDLAPARPRHRHGLPVLRALSVADGRGEHRLPAATTSASPQRSASGAWRKAAETLDLTGVLDRLPGQISEGEKQRVAVARAIVRDPNCFLFDEPLSRLDVELRQTMRGQIKEVLTGLSKATRDRHP